MNNTKHVFLVGCGRMGELVKEAIDKSPDFLATHGYDTATVSCGGLSIYSDTSLLFPCPTDIIIDFSKPEATMTILPLAAEKHIPIVICTTGFTEEQLSRIKYFSDETPIFLSSNMSWGVNVVGNILKELAVKLSNYQIEISEIHHANKADSPSGTAKLFFNIINEARGNQLTPVYGREGVRKDDEIGIASLRLGSYPGTHTVKFADLYECITIQHDAFTPAVFASGALDAARFLLEQGPGLYSMDDMLGNK